MPEAQLQPGDDLKQVPVIKMVHDLAARYHLINFLGRPTTVDRIDYHVAPIDKETAKHHWGKYAVEQAPYLNGVTTDHPDNFNYRFIIGNKLNRNYPLPYTAKPGGWKTIERTLRHVFGEYYEQMLEYHAVMLKYPEWKLPVILLLSSHNETGKSSVMELTAKMMGQNAKKIRSGDITNKFTGAWVNAQFGYVDEQSTGLEKWKQNPIIKDLCTAETAISEDKGRPTEQIKCNLKLWMASNDVFTAFPVELEDKRIWPILVEKIDRNNMINRAAYKALLEQEIPAYMYYLLNEIEINLSSPHRTYFDPDIYMNDLKIGIINQSKSSASQSIAEVLTKIFSQNLKLNEIHVEQSVIRNFLKKNIPVDTILATEYEAKNTSGRTQNKAGDHYCVRIENNEPYAYQFTGAIRCSIVQRGKFFQVNPLTNQAPHSKLVELGSQNIPLCGPFSCVFPKDSV